MSNIADYEQWLPQALTMENDKIKTPAMPVGIFAQEADDLAKVAQKDAEDLAKIGFSQVLVSNLITLSGALREAQSNWKSKEQREKDAEGEWKVKHPTYVHFRNDMVDTFRFAYRKDEQLLKAVALIDEGNSNADLIQDMNDIAVLGRNNPEPLTKMMFAMERLDMAAKYCNEGSDLLARVNGDRNDPNASRVIRDKMYTLLKEVVDEVRDNGKYVFRKDDRKSKDYASYYYRINRQ